MDKYIILTSVNSEDSEGMKPSQGTESDGGLAVGTRVIWGQAVSEVVLRIPHLLAFLPLYNPFPSLLTDTAGQT